MVVGSHFSFEEVSYVRGASSKGNLLAREKNISIGTRVRCLWGRNSNRVGNVIQTSGNSIRVDFVGVGVKCVLLNSLVAIHDKAAESENTALWIIDESQGIPPTTSSTLAKDRVHHVLARSNDGSFVLPSILRVPFRGAAGYKVLPLNQRQRRVTFCESINHGGCKANEKTANGMEESRSPLGSFKQTGLQGKENNPQLDTAGEPIKTSQPGDRANIPRRKSYRGKVLRNQERAPLGQKCTTKVPAYISLKRDQMPTSNTHSSRTGEGGLIVDVGCRIHCALGTYKGCGGKVAADHGKMVTVDFDGIGERRVMKTSLNSPLAERQW